MLIVGGTMRLRLDGFPKLRGILPSHRQRTMAEEGCLLFSLGVADEASGEVTVLEIWRDEAALASHHGEPHTAEFLRLLGDDIIDMDLSLYDAPSARPLPPLETLAHMAS